MEHYFSSLPKSELKLNKISYNNFKFLTSSSVFSKNKIDKGSLLLLKSLKLSKNDIVLDLGCGYGFLGILIASKIKKIYLTDINERALLLAKKNIELNSIKNAIIKKSYLFSNLNLKFNLIITNPPLRLGKKFIQKLIKESYLHLKSKGKFYIVIKTKQGAKSYQEFIKEIFGNCSITKKGSGYRVFIAIK